MPLPQWNNASARERLLIIVMVLVVCSALLFALLVRPAWRTIQSAPATLQSLDTKVLNMRAQAAQLRAAPAPVTPSAAAPLPGSVERELAGPGATVSEARDSAAGAAPVLTTITLKGIDGSRFAAWLARPEVHQQLQRLNLTRDPANGRVTGTVIIRITH